MPLVEIQDLQFSYGEGPLILDLPRFEIEKGERIFLFGPSGTGKTTFLELLAGILSPTQGQLRILNTDLAQLTPTKRDQFRADHCGYVFQSFNLLPYLNVGQNILLSLEFSALRKSRVTNPEQQAQELCRRLGIEALWSRPVTELSVGQQQRVAVARALMGQPDLILADEPTSALDSDHRERFLKLLFELAEAAGTTILFVSHDRSLQSLFSRVLSLSEMQRRSS